MAPALGSLFQIVDARDFEIVQAHGRSYVRCTITPTVLKPRSLPRMCVFVGPMQSMIGWSGLHFAFLMNGELVEVSSTLADLFEPVS